MPLQGHFCLTKGLLFDNLSLLSLNFGRVAERLGTGLQNPLPRFNSGRDLQITAIKNARVVKW